MRKLLAVAFATLATIVAPSAPAAAGKRSSDLPTCEEQKTERPSSTAITDFDATKLLSR